MAQRSLFKKSGYNVNTWLEILFRTGNRSYSGGGGTQSGKIAFDFVKADYIADSHGDANFRIDVNHDLNQNLYDWGVFKTENNGAILVTDWWKGESTLSLWFIDDEKTIRVIIDP